MATHRYTGEDLDELNFEPGEVIYVIPFDSPEEQVRDISFCCVHIEI